MKKRLIVAFKILPLKHTGDTGLSPFTYLHLFRVGWHTRQGFSLQITILNIRLSIHYCKPCSDCTLNNKQKDKESKFSWGDALSRDLDMTTLEQITKSKNT